MLFDVSNQEQRQRLIDIFVNAVHLYDDKIVFMFNYKEGTKTVSPKDSERSDLTRPGAGATDDYYYVPSYNGFVYYCVVIVLLQTQLIKLVFLFCSVK